MESTINNDVDIFIYSHIPFKPLVSNPVYKILTNSHENFDTHMPLFRDYEGEDNISDKNVMYNEYSGFYWLWKNYPLKKYIGLNHYRRYYEWLDNVPNIDQLFKYFNIILNKPITLSCPLTAGGGTKGQIMDNRTWYGWWHNIEDYELLEQLYHEKFPEFIDGFNKMDKSNYIYNSSMFTMTKEMFIEYCEYVFTVLDEYNKMRGMYTTEDYKKWVTANQEKYIKQHLPYYNIDIQSRLLGYIAERVMNTFMMNGNDCIEKHAAIINWIMVK